MTRVTCPEYCVEIPSKKRIARAFGLKARRYDCHAAIQTALIKRLVKKYSPRICTGTIWADLGCGTGIFGKECGSAGLAPDIVGLDIALEPLLVMEKTRKQIMAVQADIEAPPFKEESFDGAIIASVLQWLADPQTVLRRTAPILKPGGYLLFAGFVRGSFAELFATRASFGLPVSANCPEPRTLLRQITSAGFALPDQEILQDTLYFPSASALLKSISTFGGTAAAGQRLGRQELAAFCRSYEQQHKAASGIPLTWRAMISACKKGNLP
jgi:malonyl-CoA O-methyltransferase